MTVTGLRVAGTLRDSVWKDSFCQQQDRQSGLLFAFPGLFSSEQLPCFLTCPNNEDDVARGRFIFFPFLTSLLNLLLAEVQRGSSSLKCVLSALRPRSENPAVACLLPTSRAVESDPHMSVTVLCMMWERKRTSFKFLQRCLGIAVLMKVETFVCVNDVIREDIRPSCGE